MHFVLLIIVIRSLPGRSEDVLRTTVSSFAGSNYLFGTTFNVDLRAVSEASGMLAVRMISPVHVKMLKDTFEIPLFLPAKAVFLDDSDEAKQAWKPYEMSGEEINAESQKTYNE